ncbi:hypothetical protein HDG35_001662 [Paraburkholderia sp. JPY681]|uniref:Uncharacterized protein n=1 Tax=Paraburkholderia atlantica TaxID=2654982 RepID=D5WEK4_PARAM|nr:hypothetical protein BC1002_5189 [Paraburkholderia atlantica]MBB5505427.1 hypothetical protein [Paraburkholderia atlantica]
MVVNYPHLQCSAIEQLCLLTSIKSGSGYAIASPRLHGFLR